MALVALMLFVFLGAAALSVDVGFLHGARAEAQRVADLSALAGAGALLQSLDVGTARATAIEYGSRNRIRGQQVVILPGDVDVIPDSQLVRVRVHRTVERENPIQTIFARALGLAQVDVRAGAAAQAYPSTAIDGSCLLPFAIPDRWRKGDGTWPTMYDDFESPPDQYVPWPESGATGYSYPESIGFPLQLRGQQSEGASYVPSFWRHVWFWGDQMPSVPDMLGAIQGCASDEFVPIAMDSSYQRRTGNIAGPQVHNAFQHVINQDPGAYWEGPPGCNCVRGSAFGENGDGTGSPRVRPIALFNPEITIPSGNHPIPISNFIAVFIESSTLVGGQPSVWVRFHSLAGVLPGDEWEPSGGPLARVLRLVE